MNYPVFIFHELVLRLADANKTVGRYISNTIQDNECLIKTTAGKIKVQLSYLEKQYLNPKSISSEEVCNLLNGFEADYQLS